MKRTRARRPSKGDHGWVGRWCTFVCGAETTADGLRRPAVDETGHVVSGDVVFCGRVLKETAVPSPGKLLADHEITVKGHTGQRVRISYLGNCFCLVAKPGSAK